MSEFTVIAFNENTGQIISMHVEAESGLHAFYIAASESSSLTFVAALDGSVLEGSGITFPGEGLVHASTVMEQPDVFEGEVGVEEHLIE